MKYFKLFLAFIVVAAGTASFSQIGIQTNSPDASSALDIVSSNKGLLVPRVILTANLGSPNPVSSPATGLLVFNTGANQPQGFYYWGGTSWVQVSSGGGASTAWELTGNAGTTVGTNFLGTTDAEALALYTNDTERMRILDDGRVNIENGYTAPGSDDKFTVRADATHNDAISGISSAGYGVYGYSGGTYGIYGHSYGEIAVRARSQHATGTGILATGNDVGGSYPTTGSGGAFTGGAYGLYAKAMEATGEGIAAAGNGESISTLSTGSGAAFTGAKYGIYSTAENTTNGNGIGAIGNGGPTLYVPPTGSGGAFTGDSLGVYGKGVGFNGNGVIGTGNGGSTYHFPTAGSGGSFTGEVGVYGYSDLADGNAVVGLVNGGTYSTPGGEGAGGSFTGPIAVYGSSSENDGTAVIGVGNDGSNYHSSNDGSGGAFSGFHGVYGYAEDEDDGIGVIGVGNDEGHSTMGYGAGGSFTGYRYGIESFAYRQGGTNTRGVYGRYSGGGNEHGVGVYGYSYPNNGYGYGVYGRGRRYGVYANGNLGASGTKSFEIDHPLDPKNKTLKHFATESPEVLNLYRGNVVLNHAGEATVSLPDYFIAININFSYVLTPIGQQAAALHIKKEINDQGSFVIAGGNPNQKISWVVYAERNDLYMQQERLERPEQVELEKEENEKGKYIMPELYNQPLEQGIFYAGKEATKKPDKKQKVKRQKNSVAKDVAEQKVRPQEVKEEKVVLDEH